MAVYPATLMFVLVMVDIMVDRLMATTMDIMAAAVAIAMAITAGVTDGAIIIADTVLGVMAMAGLLIYAGTIMFIIAAVVRAMVIAAGNV